MIAVASVFWQLMSVLGFIYFLFLLAMIMYSLEERADNTSHPPTTKFHVIFAAKFIIMWFVLGNFGLANFISGDKLVEKQNKLREAV